MRKSGARRNRSNGEHSLKACVRRFLGEGVALPETLNIYSTLVRAFIECYLETPSEDYVTMFSRIATEALAGIYRCDAVKELLEDNARYMNTLFNEFKSVFGASLMLSLEVLTRLTIDTRNPYMPLEISLAWDPYRNTPYIPATAIKGVAKRFARDLGLDTGLVFGSEKGMGQVVFTNAYPVSCRESLIEPEVITPHYVEHEYKIDEASARPRPLVFPVVPKGVTFTVVIGIAQELVDKLRKQGSLNRFVEALRSALEKGIGAKTSLSYGYMRVSVQSSHGLAQP